MLLNLHINEVTVELLSTASNGYFIEPEWVTTYNGQIRVLGDLIGMNKDNFVW